LVLIFSEYSNLSEDVSNEVGLAFDNKSVIIPYKLNDIDYSSDLKYYCIRKDGLNAWEVPYQVHLEKLTSIITKLLHK
jgi:hypothetical protein